MELTHRGSCDHPRGRSSLSNPVTRVSPTLLAQPEIIWLSGRSGNQEKNDFFALSMEEKSHDFTLICTESERFPKITKNKVVKIGFWGPEVLWDLETSRLPCLAHFLAFKKPAKNASQLFESKTHALTAKQLEMEKCSWLHSKDRETSYLFVSIHLSLSFFIYFLWIFYRINPTNFHQFLNLRVLSRRSGER